MSERKCRGVTRSGAECRMRPLRDSEWCFAHDPRRAKERGMARRKGGQNGRRGKPSKHAGSFKIETPRDAMELLTIAANELLALDSTVPRNKALAQIAVNSLRVFEVAELAERVAALEALTDEYSFRYQPSHPALARR